MVMPMELTFRNMAHSAAIEAAVRERAAKLDKFHPRIMGCRVVVESSHRRTTKSTAYHVRVDVTVPGAELYAHRQPQLQRFHEDVYVAIRDAFDQIGRELEDLVRRQRGDVKRHEEHEMETGRVSKLFAERGYGFIEKPDGLQVYFHRNSVAGHGFERLAIGTEVHFAEEEGERGPQASAVTLG